MQSDPSALIARIVDALSSAGEVLRGFDRQLIVEQKKAGGDPVTAADLAIDEALRRNLLLDGEGWLSEETADDETRLDRPLVWVVDPLDGTREFIDGLPEFCVSVAAVIDGVPVAGGILNSAAGIEIVGARGLGVTCNGIQVRAPSVSEPDTVRILASRSEVGRGVWSVVESEGYVVVPMGSVAYKLGRVAAGLDHLTWTPVPKHEWDVAGGAALLSAAGGAVVGLDGAALRFNQERPWFSGAIALPYGMESNFGWIQQLVEKQLDNKK